MRKIIAASLLTTLKSKACRSANTVECLSFSNGSNGYSNGYGGGHGASNGYGGGYGGGGGDKMSNLGAGLKTLHFGMIAISE